MVWFVYREDYYLTSIEPEGRRGDGSFSSADAEAKHAEWSQKFDEVRGRASLNVAKQRHGSTGNVPLLFQSEFTKFTSPNFKDYSDWGVE